MMCYFTRTEFLLNEAEHKTFSSTVISSMRNGLGLLFDLHVLSYKTHFFAHLRLQALLLAPVSGMTFAKKLLITT